MSVEQLKDAVRAICRRYPNREQRARRIFLEERPAALHYDHDRAFAIKKDISDFFEVPYTAIGFTGSGQIGFSVQKDALFSPGVSDLDVAIISAHLFQRAWQDVIESTRAFSDLTPFAPRSGNDITYFKERILRRGMILVESMPRSKLAGRWSQFEDALSRRHSILFGKISLAIYMNEYAFCWKQDSALQTLMGSS